jgi:cytochrome c553
MLTRKLIGAMMFVLMLSAGGVQAGGDAAKGAELAADCADCHGDDGKGDDEVPGIAGMDAAAHAKKLADFQSGAVDSEMADYVEGLSEQDFADLAAYFATLPAE